MLWRWGRYWGGRVTPLRSYRRCVGRRLASCAGREGRFSEARRDAAWRTAQPADKGRRWAREKHEGEVVGRS